jgi:hypothetical protein
MKSWAVFHTHTSKSRDGPIPPELRRRHSLENGVHPRNLESLLDPAALLVILGRAGSRLGGDLERDDAAEGAGRVLALDEAHGVDVSDLAGARGTGTDLNDQRLSQ